MAKLRCLGAVTLQAATDTYTAGTIPNKMSAVVTTNNLTLADGSPKYSTSTSPYCYISAGRSCITRKPF